MTTPEPKPLSKERREEIERVLASPLYAEKDGTFKYVTSSIWLAHLRDLLAAEQYWREKYENDHP